MRAAWVCKVVKTDGAGSQVTTNPAIVSNSLSSIVLDTASPAANAKVLPRAREHQNAALSCLAAGVK